MSLDIFSFNRHDKVAHWPHCGLLPPPADGLLPARLRLQHSRTFLCKLLVKCPLSAGYCVGHLEYHSERNRLCPWPCNAYIRLNSFHVFLISKISFISRSLHETAESVHQYFCWWTYRTLERWLGIRFGFQVCFSFWPCVCFPYSRRGIISLMFLSVSVWISGVPSSFKVLQARLEEIYCTSSVLICHHYKTPPNFRAVKMWNSVHHLMNSMPPLVFCVCVFMRIMRLHKAAFSLLTHNYLGPKKTRHWSGTNERVRIY